MKEIPPPLPQMEKDLIPIELVPIIQFDEMQN